MCKKRKPTGGTGEIHKARPSRFLEESGECRFGTRGTTGTISPKWLRPNWKECQLQALPAEGLPPQNGYLFVLLFLRAPFLLVLLSFSFFFRGGSWYRPESGNCFVCGVRAKGHHSKKRPPQHAGTAFQVTVLLVLHIHLICVCVSFLRIPRRPLF